MISDKQIKVITKFLEFFVIQFIAYPLGGYLSNQISGFNTGVIPTMIAGSFSFAFLMTVYFTAREYKYNRFAAVVFGVLFLYCTAIIF